MSEHILAGLLAGARAPSPRPPSPARQRRYPAQEDRYELLEQIGQGTAAAVYRAWCEDVQEQVAIKVIDLEWFHASLEDIYKEIQVMSLSSHPNVVRYITSFLQGHDLWVVMPLLTGGSVRSLLDCLFPHGMDEELVRYVLHQMLKAVEYFHSRGQMHRDIKAANLLLDASGQVLLADYGVMGWMVEHGLERKQRQTFVGTPLWMAPEVMEQTHGYDAKADIWSVGITAIEMAQGRAPYARHPPMKVLFLTLQNDPPTLDAGVAVRFSEDFREVVDMCLRKDPRQRPSASAVLAHRYFRGVRRPPGLADMLAHLPPLGSRGVSQRALYRQLQKLTTGGRSGIWELNEQGLGWDFDTADAATDEGDAGGVVNGGGAGGDDDVHHEGRGLPGDHVRGVVRDSSLEADLQRFPSHDGSELSSVFGPSSSPLTVPTDEPAHFGTAPTTPLTDSVPLVHTRSTAAAPVVHDGNGNGVAVAYGRASRHSAGTASADDAWPSTHVHSASVSNPDLLGHALAGGEDAGVKAAAVSAAVATTIVPPAGAAGGAKPPRASRFTVVAVEQGKPLAAGAVREEESLSRGDSGGGSADTSLPESATAEALVPTSPSFDSFLASPTELVGGGVPRGSFESGLEAPSSAESAPPSALPSSLSAPTLVFLDPLPGGAGATPASEAARHALPPPPPSGPMLGSLTGRPSRFNVLEVAVDASGGGAPRPDYPGVVAGGAAVAAAEAGAALVRAPTPPIPAGRPSRFEVKAAMTDSVPPDTPPLPPTDHVRVVSEPPPPSSAGSTADVAADAAPSPFPARSLSVGPARPPPLSAGGAADTAVDGAASPFPVRSLSGGSTRSARASPQSRFTLAPAHGGASLPPPLPVSIPDAAAAATVSAPAASAPPPHGTAGMAPEPPRPSPSSRRVIVPADIGLTRAVINQAMYASDEAAAGRAAARVALPRPPRSVRFSPTVVESPPAEPDASPPRSSARGGGGGGSGSERTSRSGNGNGGSGSGRARGRGRSGGGGSSNGGGGSSNTGSGGGGGAVNSHGGGGGGGSDFRSLPNEEFPTGGPADGAGFATDGVPPPAGLGGAYQHLQALYDALSSLARENDALRAEVASLRASQLQRSH